MKVTAALVSLGLASAAFAQQQTLPKCAQSCADKFLTGGIGNCGSDPKCICADKGFLGGIACCLVDVCDAPAQSSAVAFAASLCNGFGVTDLPTAVSCTSTAASTTTGSASTTGSGSTSATQTGTGAASAATNSASTSNNLGPRPTAAAGLGAIGGIVAAVALL
ncbi:uncharacterized protein B0T15DRAFT_492079 [Chaetomium strumarium]|uniref:CFEM domain-containing protein n=1 Tax=Chaetomium strumarium TaxID=1170767 RepID=A0AAJ0M2D1_9PEZI|nr:hypothetical protein B0T15DRAFT_492079 [Chaetomium strumarium]